MLFASSQVFTPWPRVNQTNRISFTGLLALWWVAASLSLLQDEISKSIYLRFYIMLFPIPRTVKRCQLDNVIFLHPFSGPIWSLLLNWMVKLGPNKIFMAFSRKLKEKEAGHHQVHLLTILKCLKFTHTSPAPLVIVLVCHHLLSQDSHNDPSSLVVIPQIHPLYCGQMFLYAPNWWGHGPQLQSRLRPKFNSKDDPSWLDPFFPTVVLYFLLLCAPVIEKYLVFKKHFNDLLSFCFLFSLLPSHHTPPPPFAC